MRKNWLYLLMMILMLAGVGYIGQPDQEIESEVEPEVTAVDKLDVQAELTNHPAQFTTVEEAQKQVEFKIIIPEYLTQEYIPGKILIVDENIVEIYFYGSEDQVVYRTGQGLGNISGDYTFYDNEESIECEEVTVTAKGDSSRFSLVYFTQDDLKYSISFQKAVTKQKIINIVDSLPFY